MTATLPRSTTLSAVTAALAWTALSFGALLPTPAQAQPGNGGFYRAELAQPVEKSTRIAAGVAWKCEGSACTAPKSNSRALRVCRELAKEVGNVTAFTAKGEALVSDDLARCNG